MNWVADAVAELDDSHMAVVSSDEEMLAGFTAGLAGFLGLLPETQVVVLSGEAIATLDQFCRQLERQIPGHRLARAIDGPGGVASLLRQRPTLGFSRPAKRRYYLWNDADATIRADDDLFGRLAEVMLGVAADAEYGSDELLMIHRVVFLGGDLLTGYRNDPDGQLRSWRLDRIGEPFWASVSGVAAPRVRLRDVADLVGEPSHA
ncbi:MAG: hypothetical protein AAF108_01045 [Planctomycetota bacterium]